MKKGLKIGLIVGGSLLVAGGIWAGLTKVGIIPNWIGVEILKSYSKDKYGKCVDCNGRVLNGCKRVISDVLDDNGIRCCDGSYSYSNCQQNTIGNDVEWKPIIYLYPTEETQVNVELGTPENLSHTYPKYSPEKGRNVIAQPNGNLEDVATGRKLYALYREGKISNSQSFDEGFVVAGKDTIPFLEEKLAILGLNEREAEEFIVYWLPQMEDNEWNLIRFETIEEQNENMPLNITPKPDTVIRVMMDWKSIDEPINIPQQYLNTPERVGFTVVEWGGSPKN